VYVEDGADFQCLLIKIVANRTNQRTCDARLLVLALCLAYYGNGKIQTGLLKGRWRRCES
jgi:hypothetical protein